MKIPVLFLSIIALSPASFRSGKRGIVEAISPNPLQDLFDRIGIWDDPVTNNENQQPGDAGKVASINVVANKGFQQVPNDEPTFQEKQRAVLQILTNSFHETEEELKESEKAHFPFRNGNKFHNHEGVLRFLRNYNKNGFLPKDEVFSPNNQEHLNQAAQLFNFLFSARDWTTLRQAALWSRTRFNQQQFTYAFLAAVLNHPTTGDVTLPALYEIFPHAFVPVTALQKVYTAKFQGQKHVRISANYTNQNRNSNVYNRDASSHNTPYDNNNHNAHSNWNLHNPNSVFAGNDGSVFNTAGTPENPENRVCYFTEDIGVNAMMAGAHAQMPSFFGSNFETNYWISNKNNNNNVDVTKKGDSEFDYINQQDLQAGNEFYFMQQQLYARYVLERLANQLPVPEPINFNGIIKPGYNPRLQHSNGEAVPARPPSCAFEQLDNNDNNNNANALQPNNDQAQNPSIYEQRLQQVADSGFILNEDGSKTRLSGDNAVAVIANLATAPGRSPNPGYYGNYFTTASNAIGYIVDPNNQNSVAPGAVSNFATAARDPAYYKLLAKFLQIFNNYLNNQGPYSQEQLSFPGVKIQSFNVSRLLTYFEDFTVDVNNAVNEDFFGSDSNKKKKDKSISYASYQVDFQRLTSKPFNYQLSIDSNRNVEAVVRIFIGPKFNSNGQLFTLPQAGQYFVQLDKFPVTLRSGNNVLTRSSAESVNFSPDAPSFSDLWKKIKLAEKGMQRSSDFKAVNRRWRLPLRMQLPKGTAEGQEFVMYVIINEASAKTNGATTQGQNIVNYYEENTFVQFRPDSDYVDGTVQEIDATLDAPQFEDDEAKSSNSYEEKIAVFMKVIDDKITSQNPIDDGIVDDGRSIAFPFDRPVEDVNFNSPNQIFQTVRVYHETPNGNN